MGSKDLLMRFGRDSKDLDVSEKRILKTILYRELKNSEMKYIASLNDPKAFESVNLGTLKRTRVSNPKKRKCEFCGNTFKIRYKKSWRFLEIIRHAHINICQNPSTHYFCSGMCKIKWIFAVLSRNEILIEVRRIK